MIVMRLLRLPLALLVAGSFVPANSQWLFYHEKDTPMKDGKPDLLAKTPRTFDGHPDLSGVWAVEHSAPGEIERLYGAATANGPQATAGDDIRMMNKYFLNLFVDYKRGEEPIRPEWREHEAKVRQARASAGENNSPLRCLPYPRPTVYFNIRPFKLFQTPKELGMYSEMDGNFRWIHLDGRPLPEDPFPSWLGYSTARWDGDTLVVDSNGYNDKQGWSGGHLHSEKMRMRERFTRIDFGHMDLEITVDDPEVLTKPVTVKIRENLLPNTDILEYVCNEGERDAAFISEVNANVKKAAESKEAPKEKKDNPVR
jgi:hypothetical protein